MRENGKLLRPSGLACRGVRTSGRWVWRVAGVSGGHSTPRPLGARRNRPLDVPDLMVAWGPQGVAASTRTWELAG
jgi:hypothetical protein